MDTKREVAQKPEEKEREDREDEQPTVVVLREGDVNEEEYQRFLQQTKRDASDTSRTLPVLYAFVHFLVCRGSNVLYTVCSW